MVDSWIYSTGDGDLTAEDRALQESMGSIVDRSREMLGGCRRKTFRADHESRWIDFILEAISHTPNVV
jgi:hypothetical protein